jgi:hypothetical protein
MSALAELILNNLPIVLFLVITIVIRVFQTRVKAAREEAPPPAFASALEPDDEENESAFHGKPEAAAGGGVRTGETPVPAAGPVKKAGFYQPAAEDPRFEGIRGLSVGITPASYTAADSEPPVPPAGKNTPAAVREKSPKNGRFPLRPESLTPLQQAVVWAEILGKPKGLEERRF